MHTKNTVKNDENEKEMTDDDVDDDDARAEVDVGFDDDGRDGFLLEKLQCKYFRQQKNAQKNTNNSRMIESLFL